MKLTNRIVISGSGSHCGKTTIACGLLSSLRERGLKVCAYKTGPDYIDTEYLRRAGKCEAYNLDTWLMSPERVRDLFIETSRDKDIAVIEGAMGLYDGGANSTAEIAKLLDSPVIAVMNVQSIGETAGAIALGLQEFDRDVDFAGVILNRAGSDSHVKMIADSLERVGIKVFGALRRDDRLTIPERHLGLLPVHENESCEFFPAGQAIDLDEVMRVSEREEQESRISWPSANHKVRIGVARDEAFSFYYPESLETLRRLGAEIIYFSPIHDERIPKANGYIFGGGFPEMFASELEGNESMRESVREISVPVLAECGGYMYLCDSLTDMDNRTFKMTGIIPCDSYMTDRPVIGYIEACSLSDNIMCNEGEKIRGHEFHYSRVKQSEAFAFEMTRRRTGEIYSGGYARGNILASYLHVNFFGNIKLAERFIKSCN